MTTTCRDERGIALLAVLFALMLLMLLSLPFAVSMGVGAEAASRDVDQTAVEQASASVRDLLLTDAAQSHPLFDPTPLHDDRSEWPDHVELPAAFAELRGEGRVLLGGEVWDLQRFLSLDTASPLVFANLLGSTTRLREDLAGRATTVVLDSADALPDSGYVWTANEVIRYGGKQGNTLTDVTRGMFWNELGLADGTADLKAQTLVLDYRCVLAATWPFTARSRGSRETRQPFTSVGDLAEIAAAGLGAFTPDELDTLRASLSGDTLATTASTWGRPERIFEKLVGEHPDVTKRSRTLRVKSALHLGAGSTVRLRNLRTGTVEFNLVMTSSLKRNEPTTLQQPLYRLDLVLPVVHDFPAIDTVVEPLVPIPANINTASTEVLTAIFEELRRSADVIAHEADGQQRLTPPPSLSRSQSRELVEEIVSRRNGDGSTPGTGPFTGWQDFVERIFKPRLELASTQPTKELWIRVYRNLQTGRDGDMEMGTVPICFESGPWVGYRAAASRSRSAVAPGVAARHERTGLAAAVPGYTLEHVWNTQERFEEALRLDRRSQLWTTTPINLGAAPPGATDDPPSRHYPNLVPIAYPDMGLGSVRFAAKDPADAGIEPATASVSFGNWSMDAQQLVSTESFSQALDPRGHDVKKEGPFQMENTGPRGGGAGAPAATVGRHDGIQFPFSTVDGYMGRFATSFWLQPQSLANVTLFDHSDGDNDRNRLALMARDDNLVLEVVDEAGIDPNPSDSPAGVERSATQWNLPLAELGLPADTPVHVSMSAYGGRPSELSVAIDGMTRGKVKYVTYLTGPLKALDPTLSNNNTAPGTTGNERYLDIQVESTEGFPPVGTLRIGTELFEYSGISGNTFQGKWKDSVGGRARRQDGREFRPNIPVDANGEATVDLDELQAQGLNLAVFPEHPVDSLVELYGYSALLSEDTPMMVGSTRLDSGVGGFAVARGFINNPKVLTITPQQGPPLTIGNGLDQQWTGELELADPVETGDTQPPTAGQASVVDAFPTSGGYAVLMQRRLNWEGASTPGGLTSTTQLGGIEVIRYTSRNGNKLTGVQRAQRLPGDDRSINKDLYDGSARGFVQDYEDNWRFASNPNLILNSYPTLILWVVPISLSVQDARFLADPQTTKTSEWLQLLPTGDAADIEWVRYDAIVQGKHVVRGNRAAWEEVFYELTTTRGADNVQVGPLGTTTSPSDAATKPWGTVTSTSGYIGYVPKVEADFPQVLRARSVLGFRGDPLTETTSHAQNNSMVTQCQRLQLLVSNWGAFSGRVGRHDRIALVQGSASNGTKRPLVEWHSVTWSARQFRGDNLSGNANPDERLGPKPFQLVAFKDGVQAPFIGPAPGVRLEPRLYDRLVKFPSGELPSAYCEKPTVGGSVGKGQPITGFVDEVEVRSQPLPDLILEEACTADARTFRVAKDLTYAALGTIAAPGVADGYPKSGGLLSIDGEIVAYQSYADGVFTVATNGRGLLHTDARGHDRGARAHFLAHRPVAILGGNVTARDTTLPVQSVAPLDTTRGTVLLGRELLHYTWVLRNGDQGSLDMPRWYPPGEDTTSPAARGLFRGRFGTTAQGGSSGEALIAFPFRYWDRQADRSDDPELAGSQLTTTEAPALYRSLRWRQETTDPRVGVACLVRTDSKAPWSGEPGATAGLWRFDKSPENDDGHRLDAPGSRLEIRFMAVYKPGVLDLQAFRSHGWKTSVRVEDVRVEYEGQGRIFDERVTAR